MAEKREEVFSDVSTCVKVTRRGGRVGLRNSSAGASMPANITVYTLTRPVTLNREAFLTPSFVVFFSLGTEFGTALETLEVWECASSAAQKSHEKLGRSYKRETWEAWGVEQMENEQ